MARLTSSLCQS